MSCEMAARATTRRLINPPFMNGRPKAAMEARSITVLSRSKKAASMDTMLKRWPAHTRPPVINAQQSCDGLPLPERGQRALVADEEGVHRVLGIGRDQHQ